MTMLEIHPDEIADLLRRGELYFDGGGRPHDGPPPGWQADEYNVCWRWARDGIADPASPDGGRIFLRAVTVGKSLMTTIGWMAVFIAATSAVSTTGRDRKHVRQLKQRRRRTHEVAEAALRVATR